MSLDLDYQRAAEVALAADKAAADAHAALFDFARQLGDLSTQVQARSAPLPLRVRFVRLPSNASHCWKRALRVLTGVAPGQLDIPASSLLRERVVTAGFDGGA